MKTLHSTSTSTSTSSSPSTFLAVSGIEKTALLQHLAKIKRSLLRKTAKYVYAFMLLLIISYALHDYFYISMPWLSNIPSSGA